ncbi:MAG: hypothetical protein KDA92_14065 [Planctomycetales bacterium]|nr:hypothetical protein [Planctomycetales bacterium]
MLHANNRRRLLICFAIMACAARGVAQESHSAATPPAVDKDSPDIAPAVSTQTGLLLEPPLTLPELTRERFVELVSTVGKERIGRPWTSPVVKLAAHQRAGAQGLTHEEVQAYMVQAKQLFDEGRAVPVSDVGLISTQEDVIRQPMLNHIAAFENDVARVYLLVQKTAADRAWSYYSIVQDLTLNPPRDYFGQIHADHVRFEAQSCSKCHSSGPLAIHPNRADLVLDAKLAAALNQHIATQPRSRMYFPDYDPPPPRGELLKLDFCASCHADDGDRGPLYQVHAHPIRVMVDFGFMPPDRRLDADEVAELKAWLERK